MSFDGGLKHAFIKLRTGWLKFSKDTKDDLEDAMTYIGGGNALSAAQAANMGSGFGQAAQGMSGITNVHNGGGSGMGGGGLGGLPPSYYAGGGGGLYSIGVINRTQVTIDTVENGFMVTIDGKAFVCETAEDVSQRVLAQMVTQKLEK
jgi:hypothetical protein